MPNSHSIIITALLGACAMVPGLAEKEILPKVEPKSSYVVLVSEATASQPEWMEAANILRRKHDASLIVYPAGKVWTCLPELTTMHPRYAAFVTPPEEAGRDFVVAVHRLTRRLDDDPYTDLRWGIVTGYVAADAARIARRTEPLVIKSIASSMGPGHLNNIGAGFASSETDASEFWTKAPGGEAQRIAVDPDPVERLARAFSESPPDLFLTSGHATEEDWQVIYNKDLGSFRCENGKLYGLNSKKQRFDFDSAHPKIYLPAGNCLIGHIPRRDCMATAWMHSGGVHQMVGYTAVTFDGFMGWGTDALFQRGLSLSEAFYFNNQALLHALGRSFPAQAGIEFDSYDHKAINRLVRDHKITEKKLLGLLWDRDTVAFYGDPAWHAALPADRAQWKAEFTHQGEDVRVRVSFLADGKWADRPLPVPFPHRLGGIRLVEAPPGMGPVITDDFVLIPCEGKAYKAGETIEVRFGAHAIESQATSAGAAPIPATGADRTAGAADAMDNILTLPGIPEGLAPGVGRAIHSAGPNRFEIVAAFQHAPPAHREDLAFLVANMPLSDLRSLNAGFLLENVEQAKLAFDQAPWRESVIRDCYLDYVLPYASLNERRDAWRSEFREKLTPLVKGIPRPGEAAIKLNQEIFKLFGVSYHATKRPRPDQGPMESIEAGYASCTGLSILLVDACRAVGIPARIAGVAQWTDSPGNHTWVEVWDDGWHCIGASESKALNDVWFGKGAAAAEPADPFKRIYAARFQRGTLHFPLAWDPYRTDIPAEDVTAWYRKRFGGGGE